MERKEFEAWLAEFFQASGVHDTFVHAISSLRTSLPDLQNRVAGTRKEDLEEAFDSRFETGEIFDRFVRGLASNLALRQDLLPETARVTGARELLSRIHRPFNEATRKGDYGPAVEAFLAAEHSDEETGFIYRTLAENYEPLRSLISKIAYPAFTYDFAVIEAQNRVQSGETGPAIYGFGPVSITAIKETSALASGFVYAGLHDRPERDVLNLATFLSSDDGSRWSYQFGFTLDSVISGAMALLSG